MNEENNKRSCNKDKKYQWRCTVCGHIYDGDTIPRDYKCPVCGSPMPKFEKEEVPANEKHE